MRDVSPANKPPTKNLNDLQIAAEERPCRGWGYAQFNYDSAADTFTPEGSGTNCGAACHTIAAAKDYIFTAYGKR
jgi:Cytochrome P460